VGAGAVPGAPRAEAPAWSTRSWSGSYARAGYLKTLIRRRARNLGAGATRKVNPRVAHSPCSRARLSGDVTAFVLLVSAPAAAGGPKGCRVVSRQSRVPPRASRGDMALGYTCHVEFARHRSVACIIGIGLTLGACGGTHAAVMRRAPVERRTTTARTEAVGSGPCRISRVAASEPGGQLVPGTPGAMTLCRYAGLPYRLGQRLVGFAYVRRESVVERLTRELDALPPVPEGTFACPDDNGSEAAVVLRYAHKRPMLIEIRLTGCPDAVRGAIRRWGLGPPGARLISDLERLILMRRA
jgi:hypothetical protein